MKKEIYNNIRPSAKVLEAMDSIDRKLFLEKDYQNLASLDTPLPIGFNQTTSQPSLIAEMITLLEINDSDEVLEIGTGSGYQTAILAQLAKKVFTMEIIPELLKKAIERLKKLKINNVEEQNKSGFEKWGKSKVFEKIIVSAACDEIPNSLIEQLKPSGTMIIPLGTNSNSQKLILLKKDEKGNITEKNLFDVRFVQFKK
jgi:protein-L-isoaspartate(D-aspartate) O-methyltransferase